EESRGTRAARDVSSLGTPALPSGDEGPMQRGHSKAMMPRPGVTVTADPRLRVRFDGTAQWRIAGGAVVLVAPVVALYPTCRGIDTRLVVDVALVTFNGEAAVKKGQGAVYVTERAVFRRSGTAWCSPRWRRGSTSGRTCSRMSSSPCG